MPRKTDTMEEGVVSCLLAKLGDKVEAGDVYAEIETDKATMEWESFEEGTILHVGIKEGDAVPVDAPVFIIGEEGEDISNLLPQFDSNYTAAPVSDKQVIELPSSSNETQTQVASNYNEEVKTVDTSNIKATVVRMRKMTDTMEDGVLANWLVAVGDKVEIGDPIAEVETDKATMDFETFEEGTILYLAVEDGTAVAIDGIIAVIGEEGADYQALLNAPNPTNQNQASQNSNSEVAQNTGNQVVISNSNTQTAVVEVAIQNSGERLKASPLAKRLAKEKGFNISEIVGSGEAGRIIKRDVENYVPQSTIITAKKESISAPKAAIAPVTVQSQANQNYRDEKVSQMRKAIARRLGESKFSAPHFYLTISIDMDKAIETRKYINGMIAPAKVSFNDIVIKAAAAALRKHPAVNAAWLGDKIRYNEEINIGVAVAVDEGLIVPVVRQANTKSLSEINGEVRKLAAKARDKKLQPSEWEGNTFTVSNLGMFGIEEFTAIINPPDACIMAVGAIRQIPVVKNGEIVIGNEMKVTLSCDHRVVDGAIGAPFLQTFKQLVEDPIRMIV